MGGFLIFLLSLQQAFWIPSFRPYVFLTHFGTHLHLHILLHLHLHLHEHSWQIQEIIIFSIFQFSHSLLQSISSFFRPSRPLNDCITHPLHLPSLTPPVLEPGQHSPPNGQPCQAGVCIKYALQRAVKAQMA
jgi:hypothetical protein